MCAFISLTTKKRQQNCIFRRSKSRKMILSKDKFDPVRRNPYSIIVVVVIVVIVVVCVYTLYLCLGGNATLADVIPIDIEGRECKDFC